MATVCILWFIIRPPADQSSTLKQDTTQDHSRVFQDRRRARGERDSRKRFFICDFFTNVCRLFPTLLWAIFRRSFFKSYTRQFRMSSVGWNGYVAAKRMQTLGLYGRPQARYNKWLARLPMPGMLGSTAMQLRLAQADAAWRGA